MKAVKGGSKGKVTLQQWTCGDFIFITRSIANHRVCTDEEDTNSQIAQQDQVLQLENGRGLVSIHKVFASPKTLTKRALSDHIILFWAQAYAHLTSLVRAHLFKSWQHCKEIGGLLFWLPANHVSLWIILQMTKKKNKHVEVISEDHLKSLLGLLFVNILPGPRGKIHGIVVSFSFGKDL